MVKEKIKNKIDQYDNAVLLDMNTYFFLKEEMDVDPTEELPFIEDMELMVFLKPDFENEIITGFTF